jgi:hypothetical protein
LLSLLSAFWRKQRKGSVFFRLIVGVPGALAEHITSVDLPPNSACAKNIFDDINIEKHLLSVFSSFAAQ